MRLSLAQKIVSNSIMQSLKTSELRNFQTIFFSQLHKYKFAGQKWFSVFDPATFFQFKSETHFRLLIHLSSYKFKHCLHLHSSLLSTYSRGSHSKVQWENAKKVWYYENWVGHHASFPPRRSVKLYMQYWYFTTKLMLVSIDRKPSV